MLRRKNKKQKTKTKTKKKHIFVKVSVPDEAECVDVGVAREVLGSDLLFLGFQVLGRTDLSPNPES